MVTETYSLQVGLAGASRLEIMNRLYNPKSQQFLLASGLANAKQVLEVGCGTGIMTCWLAQQIGSNGKVVAIDSSDQQLELAQQKAHAAGLKNIEFKRLSTYDLAELQQQFDLVYSRWVLVHLARPVLALQAMYQVLKPGGVLTCEDIDLASFFCNPASEVLQRFVTAHVALFEAQAKNPRVANDLYAYFRDVGCEKINAQLSQPVLQTLEEKMIEVMALIELKNAFLSQEILTEYEFDQLVDDMTTLVQQDIFDAHAYNVLISGIKP